jgi:protein-disulfide isomerase
VLDRYPQDVKVVYKNFPLQSHKYARAAAAAALAANMQGKYWEFHHKLFEAQKDLNDDTIQRIASELNLDMAKFNSDMKSPAVDELINGDMRNGYDVGLQGTPTIYVNGKLLKRPDMQGLVRMIELELKTKGKNGQPGS